MTTAFFTALIAGAVAALIAGMISGIIIGKDAIGTEMAAGMGGLYGLLGGTGSALIGLIVLNLI